MNKIFNSPIVIAFIVIIAAFVLKAQTKPQLASEIRGAYDEIIRIAEEAGADAEKTEAIREFSEQIASQLKTGFSSGFSSGDAVTYQFSALAATLLSEAIGVESVKNRKTLLSIITKCRKDPGNALQRYDRWQRKGEHYI